MCCSATPAEAAQTDGETTPRSLREAEAECVALLCCEALGLPGADECRGYIQHWYGRGIRSRNARRSGFYAWPIRSSGPAALRHEGGRP